MSLSLYRLSGMIRMKSILSLAGGVLAPLLRRCCTVCAMSVNVMEQMFLTFCVVERSQELVKIAPAKLSTLAE